MNYTRIAVISEYPRLARPYNVWRKLQRATHDSWPAMIGTKEHKRRVIRRDRVAERFCTAVRKEFGITKWNVKLFHGRYDDTGPVIVWLEEK